MSTHTAFAIIKPGTVDEIQVPTSSPDAGEVLIKVEYTSLNVVDTYMTDFGFFAQSFPVIPGLNVSGTVAKLGDGVTDLAVGDRVVAVCWAFLNSKGTQEYTIQPRFAISQLPDSLSLEEAVTIPDNLITAFFILFNLLELPIPPSFPTKEVPPLANTPILIYGAGSTSGQYTIQLLFAAGYTKILVTASPRHHGYLKSIGATYTFDYNSPNLVAEISKAIDGKVPIVVDCIATDPSLNAVAKVVSPTGKAAILMPIKKANTLIVKQVDDLIMEFPEDNAPFYPTVKTLPVFAFTFDQNPFLRDNLAPKIIPSLLETGIIKPNRLHLVDQGTLKERVIEGLNLLRENKISGEKLIVKVSA